MDRDKILEAVARIDDQFSKSIYKKTYNIDDRELAAVRNKMKHGEGSHTENKE